MSADLMITKAAKPIARDHRNTHNDEALTSKSLLLPVLW